MARRKAKIAWGKICFWLASFALIGIVIGININRFNHNIYANYEKAVEYGRVREEKVHIEPVIAAIFYADKNHNNQYVSAYLDHSANYKKHHVKIVAVPPFLTSDSVDVVEKLYYEIGKNNQIKTVAVVLADQGHAQKHNDLLKKVLKPWATAILQLSQDNQENQAIIENYLQQEGGLVVVLTDLSADMTQDFLVQKTIYWAQKYAYNMNVFDVVDTKMAQAMEKDYSTLLALQNDNQEKHWQVLQKNNLEQYVRRYGTLLRHWFALNVARAAENLPPMWPLKSAETYRLYDRGTLYAETGQFEKLVNNQGIVVALVRMAQRLVHKNVPVNGVRLYLLTESEEIWPQTTELDDDDGVYLRYKSHKAVVLPDQRPYDWHQLEDLLRYKAKIPADADVTDFKFYKFKIVEINDEN